MKYFLYKVIIIGLTILCFCYPGYADDMVSHDFNDGTLGRFFECTSKSPNYTNVTNSRVITHWYENAFNGSRVSKGTEACASLDDFISTKETWFGFTLNIDASHRNDTQSGIAQIFQFVDDSSIFTWTGMLKYQEGDLTFVRRSAKNISSQVEKTLVEEVARGTDHQIIVHYILSAQNAGEVEIWVDDVKVYGDYNINFGFGHFNTEDEQYDDTYIELKFGQYNYQVSEYQSGEERIIYYDDVTWYNGSDGFSIVNPSRVKLFNITKHNATDYSIDGNIGAENALDVYLWHRRDTNANQQWYEINKGDGYYSYQKYNTEYCLDGGNGAENGQNIYLWHCEDDNQNQQWKKVYIDSNKYMLLKRNAPAFAIDGDNDGSDGQSIYLWEIGGSNRNREWDFNAID